MALIADSANPTSAEATALLEVQTYLLYAHRSSSATAAVLSIVNYQQAVQQTELL